MIWLFHLLMLQKNLNKKEKLDKAKKRYEKAQKLLIKSNKKNLIKLIL